MRKTRLIIVVMFSLIIEACGGQSDLPAAMPEDFKIVLIEQTDDNQRRFIGIAAETLEVGDGSGWHNRSKNVTKIPRPETENLYRLVVENRFDRIKNESTGNRPPRAQNNSITIFYDRKAVTVYDGLLPLSAENKRRFEIVRGAVLELARLSAQ